MCYRPRSSRIYMMQVCPAQKQLCPSPCSAGQKGAAARSGSGDRGQTDRQTASSRTFAVSLSARLGLLSCFQRGGFGDGVSELRNSQSVEAYFVFVTYTVEGKSGSWSCLLCVDSEMVAAVPDPGWPDFLIGKSSLPGS